jgi:hypothetical protein
MGLADLSLVFRWAAHGSACTQLAHVLRESGQIPQKSCLKLDGAPNQGADFRHSFYYDAQGA